jgi:tetratricopeptide (TPR) repeat protein
LASADSIDGTSMAELAEIAVDTTIPAIIRASAASRLRLDDAPGSRQLVNQLASNPEPLVRWAIALALLNSHPQLTVQYGPALLEDQVRSVRITAASALAGIDPTLAATVPYKKLQAGIDEYLDAQRVNQERWEAHVNIANLHRTQGRLDQAEQEYLIAITLNPNFVPGYVNLADLFRERQQEKDAEDILRKGLGVQANQPDLHHSLGLSLIRQQRMDEALGELELAAKSPEATARFVLVYAVALNSVGKVQESVDILAEALQNYGSNTELLNAYNEFRQQL